MCLACTHIRTITAEPSSESCNEFSTYDQQMQHFGATDRYTIVYIMTTSITRLLHECLTVSAAEICELSSARDMEYDIGAIKSSFMRHMYSTGTG